METQKKIKAFISYAHLDEVHANILIKGIKDNTKHSEKIDWDIWLDKKIPLGSKWDEEIKTHIDESDVVILLVSPNFLSSGYIETIEFPLFIDKIEKEKQFLFFPVMLMPSQLKHWKELNERQYFVAKGKMYGHKNVENFTYGNISIGDENEVHRHQYHVDLVNQMEHTILSQLNTKIEDKGSTEEVVINEDVIENFTNVPIRDPKFTGRRTELMTFIPKLINNDTIAVTGLRGMGGVGKTALVVEICNIFKSSWSNIPAFPDYLNDILGTKEHFKDGILWIRFESRETNDVQIERILKRLGLNTNVKDIYKVFYGILDLLAKKEVLIVLDSAEQNKESFKYFFRLFRKIQLPIIVTSREKIPGIDSIDIERLNEEDAFILFQNYLNRNLMEQEVGILKDLFKAVGYLPLAIKILACRSDTLNKDAQELKKEFEEKKLSILKTDNLTEDEKKNLDAHVCFAISYDTLLESQKGTFVKAGIFNHPFSIDVLSKLDDKQDISGELDTLVRFTLIEKNIDDRTFDLHPLMKEYAREKLDDFDFKDTIYEVKENIYMEMLNSNTFTVKHIPEILSIIRKLQNENGQRYLDYAIDIQHYMFRGGYLIQCMELINQSITVARSLNNAEDNLRSKEDNELQWYVKKMVVLEWMDKWQECNNLLNEVKIKFNQGYFKKASLERRLDFSTLQLYRWYANIEPSKRLELRFKYIRDSYIANVNNIPELLSRGLYEDLYNKHTDDLLSNLAVVTLNSVYTINNPVGLQISFLILINIQRINGNYNLSVELFERFYIVSKLDLDTQIIKQTTLMFLLRTYLDIHDYESSKNTLYKFEQVSKEMGIACEELKYYYSARIAYINEDYKKAIELMYCLDYPNDLVRFKSLPDSYNFILLKSYLKINDTESAKKHLDIIISENEKKQDKLDIAITNIWHSLYCVLKNDTDKAIELFILGENTLKDLNYNLAENKGINEIRDRVIEVVGKEKFEEYTHINKRKVIETSPDYQIKDIPERHISLDGKEMLLIPEGGGLTGSGEIPELDPQKILANMQGYFDEEKRKVIMRHVFLYPYYIDKHPVTNKEYNEFCQSAGYQKPAHWEEQFYHENAANHPVVNISLEDAKEYAKWAGKMLPSEVEWEIACRGRMGQNYAWGNEWDNSIDDEINKLYADVTMILANGDEHAETDNSSFKLEDIESEIIQTVLERVFTTKLQNISEFGIHNMTGWINEWIDTGEQTYSEHVKGGGWLGGRSRSRLRFKSNKKETDWLAYSKASQLKGTTSYDIGFRCVKPIFSNEDVRKLK